MLRFARKIFPVKIFKKISYKQMEIRKTQKRPNCEILVPKKKTRSTFENRFSSEN